MMIVATKFLVTKIMTGQTFEFTDAHKLAIWFLAKDVKEYSVIKHSISVIQFEDAEFTKIEKALMGP